MISQPSGSPPEKPGRKPRRGPTLTRDKLLATPAVKALFDTIQAHRRTTGSTGVQQAEVDQTAKALLEEAGLPPYPTLVRMVTGGSNSTVGPMLANWWQRYGAHSRDTNKPGLPPETKLDRQLRLLISQLETTLREKLQGAPDPLQALIAAAQLGEQQGTKAQLEAAITDRERLRKQVEALTYKVAELEARLATHAATRLSEQSALELGLDRLTASLDHLSTQLAAQPSHTSADLDQLTTQVRHLITKLARPRRSTHTHAVARTAQTPRDRRRRPARSSRTKISRRVPGTSSSRRIRKRHSKR
jgi:hypothetical protein